VSDHYGFPLIYLSLVKLGPSLERTLGTQAQPFKV
jgi:hypothetical protein